MVKHAIIAILLTLLTQIGGVIWLLSRVFQRKLLSFILIYVLASLAMTWLAPIWDMKRLPCFGIGATTHTNVLMCTLNRNFATQDAAKMLARIGGKQARAGNSSIAVLDAGFPISGVPLLPHLSHKDGKKIDIALPYRDNKGKSRNGRSPIGYFAFDYPQTETCPPAFPTMRWDLKWLQWLFPEHERDEARLKSLLLDFTSDPAIEKIFIEPHLAKRVGVSHPKIRFQGCRAARHDDHIHLQIH